MKGDTMAKDDGKTNYLVFEREEDPSEQYVQARGPRGEAVGPMVPRRPPVALLGYTCIGAVRAKDEAAAVQAVIKATRRVSAYALIPATFLDFTKEEDTEVDAMVPELNP